MKKSNTKIFVEYNSPIKTGERMKIRLRLSNNLGFANDLKVLFNRHGEEPGGETKCYLVYNDKLSTCKSSVFEGEISFNTPGYRTFYIEVKLNGVLHKIEYDEESENPALIIEGSELNYFEQFVYLSSFETPDWVKGGIMYQIFVDTFCAEDIPEHLREKVVPWGTYPKWKADSDGVYRNNQFYGGNLKGIIKKLPYIKTLGVTVIYLTPIFKSSSSNRYDIEDYEQIDEMIGTWDDLYMLKKEANKLGIYLIVDQVFNHSSNKNKLLTNNPEMYDWEEKYTKPKCWWGYEHLVEFNKYSNDYFEYFTKCIKMYQKYMDGFRFDVADNLPDHVIKYIRNSSSNVMYLLGEVWKNAVTGEYREFLYGDELDGHMNYQFGNAILRYTRWGNIRDFKSVVERICKLYPPQALDVCPIFLSSHDTPRIPNSLVGNFMKESLEFENIWDMDKDSYWYDGDIFNTERFRNWEVEHDFIPEDKRKSVRNKHKIAIFMQYTSPGLPAIFAGDEAGALGFKDPTNRKTFPWDNIDEDLYEFYVKIGKFRMRYREIFADSRNYKPILDEDEKRIYKWGNLICLVNRSKKDILIKKYNLKNMVFSSLKGVKKEHILPAESVGVIYL